MTYKVWKIFVNNTYKDAQIKNVLLKKIKDL